MRLTENHSNRKRIVCTQEQVCLYLREYNSIKQAIITYTYVSKSTQSTFEITNVIVDSLDNIIMIFGVIIDICMYPHK